VLEQFDVNHDGTISLQEMLSVWGSVRTKQLLEVFNQYDVDGNGSIEAQELYEVLSALLGDDIDQDFVVDLTAEVIVRADNDNDNSISFEEFVKAVDAGVIRLDG
jgi:Ca2+-binding EF-hand superfamily protein